jgi:hypothetical protein
MILFAGWGIYEEYEEPTPDSDFYEAMKPVKRVVKKEKHHCADDHGHSNGKAFLCGVTKVSDVEEALGLE